MLTNFEDSKPTIWSVKIWYTCYITLKITKYRVFNRNFQKGSQELGFLDKLWAVPPKQGKNFVPDAVL